MCSELLLITLLYVVVFLQHEGNQVSTHFGTKFQYLLCYCTRVKNPL